MVSKEALVVGALLQDIGVFAFGTSDPRTGHTVDGESFVSEYVSRYRCMLPLLEDVRRLVARRDQDDSGRRLLEEADRLAGVNRHREGGPEGQSLRSALAKVDIGKGAPPEDIYRYTPGPVDFANPFPERIPVSLAEGKSDQQRERDELSRAWTQFCDEMRAMPDGDLASWVETFLAVARKHLSHVASAATSCPDISLYDHGRSVAAIAVCLREARQEDRPFLLVQGDISGIQTFLYKLASPAEPGGTKNMAKRLRGRSLFLVLLAETVARYYLRKLDLPPTSLLYCGGGHFLILAPHTEEIKTRWRQAEEDVNHWLVKKYRGELALVSAGTSADKKLLKDDFSRLRQQSGSALNRAKRQKFKAVLDARLFMLPDEGQQMDVCSVCQADFGKNSGETCPECRAHVEMGRQAVSAKYLIRLEGERLKGAFSPLGFAWELADNWQEVIACTAADRMHLERLNTSNFLTREDVALGARYPGLSFGFRPLGQYAPGDQDGPLDFAHLAKSNAEKYPLLGVVRIDVDALGAVFASSGSLPCTATLSRELETFFSGYVNTVARRYDMYITYAGGDDLFAVGSWINAIRFSRALRQAFGCFCGNNPNLSFSGGLLFCKPDFPIGRAAKAAGELEKEAKNHEGKNAAALFGEVVSWKRLDELLDFGKDLLYLMNEAKPDDRLPRSFVQHLLSLEAERRCAQGAKGLQAEIRTQMHLKYLVARRGATSDAISANREMEENERRVGALGRLVCEPELMRQIAIPASYVLYNTRNLDKE